MPLCNERAAKRLNGAASGERRGERTVNSRRWLHGAASGCKPVDARTAAGHHRGVRRRTHEPCDPTVCPAFPGGLARARATAGAAARGRRLARPAPERPGPGPAAHRRQGRIRRGSHCRRPLHHPGGCRPPARHGARRPDARTPTPRRAAREGRVLRHLRQQPNRCLLRKNRRRAIEHAHHLYARLSRTGRSDIALERRAAGLDPRGAADDGQRAGRCAGHAERRGLPSRSSWTPSS